MPFTRTIHSDLSGHTLHISEVDASSVPDFPNKSSYTKFYAVRNWDAEGVTFMYLGKGYEKSPNQIVVWYAKSGAFWSGFGASFKTAIEGAQKDGWMYA